jgi:hypothetical protein
MATKRRPLQRALRTRITPEAIEAFRRGDSFALDRALQLKPWDQSPLYAVTDEPPDYMRDTLNVERWKYARELRRELERAAA